MTQNYAPAIPTTEIPVYAPADDSPPATTDVAKDQAAQVGQGAAEAGQHVSGVVKDQAATVANEAGRQAKDLMQQAQSELGNQASAQQQKLAAGLRSLGDELHSMSQHSEQPGVATELAKQAAGRTHDIAQFLEDREPGHLVGELRDFARQRPVMFLAIAAGVGLLAGRLTRGVTASSDDSGSEPAPLAAQPVGSYRVPAGPLWAPPADLPVADYAPVAEYPADGLR